MMPGPKGYYTDSSYVGFMPNGKKEYFVSDTEYLEAYYEEAGEQSTPAYFLTRDERMFRNLNDYDKYFLIMMVVAVLLVFLIPYIYTIIFY